MAKKPQREVVEEIVKNLVDAEISGLQALAKDMAERVKQLEEHSIRIKQYANEIEKLAMEAASEKYDKASLDELIKNLEKTLTKLRKKQTGAEESLSSKNALVSSFPGKSEEKEDKSVVSKDDVSSSAAARLRQPLYTTPEGFVVRKTRG